MLVLTRTASAGDHTVLIIGDDIEVTVLEAGGGQVRLGITAPKSVPGQQRLRRFNPKCSRHS